MSGSDGWVYSKSTYVVRLQVLSKVTASHLPRSIDGFYVALRFVFIPPPQVCLKSEVDNMAGITLQEPC